MAIEGNYSVQKGDTLWNLAETQLKAKGNSKPTNAQIIQAMNKMAQATETQAVEDAKPASPAKEKAVITASQKTMIDEFRNMNFNSPELRVRPYINNANTYAEYFASNSQWSVINTIIADDGGKILIYGDENGKPVGSVNKDPEGKIRNVSLNFVNGGFLSLNSSQDGEIKNVYCTSPVYDVQTEDGKTSFDFALNKMMSQYDSYEVKQMRNGDRNISSYIVDGEEVVQVITDAKGKIISIIQTNTELEGGVQQRFFYTDIDGDGLIDKGEGKTRFDKRL